MERDVYSSPPSHHRMTDDRSIPITLLTSMDELTIGSTTDPNDPHYLYQERKKSRMLQRSMSEIMHPSDVPPPPPAVVLQGDPNDPHTLLRAVFHYYCRFGRTKQAGVEATLDNVNFAKFCRECPQLVGPTFTMVDVDLTFCKVKIKGERRITYAMFLEALGIMALKKFPNMALDAAVPKLLQDHVATLACLQPGLSSPHRSSIVSSRITTHPSSSKSPPRHGSVVVTSAKDPFEPASQGLLLDKAQLSLETFERQVHMVDSLSQRWDGATAVELQDLEDRIKFCYMLQDEVHGFLGDVPRGHEASRRMGKDVELLSTTLEASVKYMVKMQIHRSSVVSSSAAASSPLPGDSPRGKENAALRKLFPNGPAQSVQDAMKKIMQLEEARIIGQLKGDMQGASRQSSIVVPDVKATAQEGELGDKCLDELEATARGPALERS
ncbi:Aste57867_22178 [Aphanomyces stellatus]|uniref:Aste57867_22178 protein n=1 Tax=Aphanomyces stellatus TaxID=120398 RepID=A0A485LKB5_9STRA|nr:hypothetical protein As57867_022109 [Aphanomyces stellatus]VFT98845.1 Aste57867_22178 [Aphanomyces stellatus]